MVYDLAIHLAGKQSIPNLLGIRGITASRHLLITSKDTHDTLTRLKKCEPDIQIDELLLDDPFDLARIIPIVRQKAESYQSLALNLTGGTKMMAIGAMFGLPEIKTQSHFFYYDTNNERVFSWEAEGEVQESAIEKSLRIEDFINLSAFSTQKSGVDMDQVQARKGLTEKIWKYRHAYSKIQSEAQKVVDAKKKNYVLSRTADTTESVTGKDKFDKKVKLEYQNNRIVQLSFDRTTCFSEIYDQIDFEYLAGRWFEEFTYWKLKQLEERGEIREMLLGSKVMFDRDGKKPAQEFDLLVTDGLRLFIIECKAGDIKQEYLQKLENITKDFGGVMGQGILVAQWLNSSQVTTIERTEKSSSIACLHGNNLDKILPQKLLTIKAGEIYPAL